MGMPDKVSPFNCWIVGRDGQEVCHKYCPECLDIRRYFVPGSGSDALLECDKCGWLKDESKLISIPDK